MTDEHIRDLIAALKELHEERFGLIGEALRLQAAEYERRLEVLNGDRAEAIRVQGSFLTVDKFETWADQKRLAEQLAAKEVQGRLDLLSVDITNLKDQLGRREAQGSGAKSAYGYIVGAVGLVAVLLSIWSAVH
jgi:hypothetical protein